MDWYQQARQLFKLEKPEHFTRYWHCDECAEHDEVLCQFDLETITLEQLGNPSWDPICFCSEQGKQYYLPAMVRLTLESMQDEFYLGQWLFHLQLDGPKNSFYLSCSPPQRTFIVDFLSYLLETYLTEIEQNMSGDDLLAAVEIWSAE